MLASSQHAFRAQPVKHYFSTKNDQNKSSTLLPDRNPVVIGVVASDVQEHCCCPATDRFCKECWKLKRFNDDELQPALIFRGFGVVGLLGWGLRTALKSRSDWMRRSSFFGCASPVRDRASANNDSPKDGDTERRSG